MEKYLMIKLSNLILLTLQTFILFYKIIHMVQLNINKLIYISYRIHRILLPYILIYQLIINNFQPFRALNIQKYLKSLLKQHLILLLISNPAQKLNNPQKIIQIITQLLQLTRNPSILHYHLILF